MSNLIRLGQAKPDVQRRFMTGVYLRMFFALLITAATAYLTANFVTTNVDFQKNYSTFLTVCIVAELAVVLIISFCIRKINPFVAYLLFILYSALTGVSLSTIFFIFEIESIFQVFITSALMFLGMSIYGAFTKSDLRSAGRYLMMALIGVCIISLFNFFFKFQKLDWILNIVSVGIFIGLTAYDTQKILNIAIYDDGSAKFKKFAVLGALELYVDFINIFIRMLYLFGKKRD